MLRRVEMRPRQNKRIKVVSVHLLFLIKILASCHIDLKMVELLCWDLLDKKGFEMMSFTAFVVCWYPENVL